MILMLTMPNDQNKRLEKINKELRKLFNEQLSGKKQTYKILFRPNNYRRQVRVQKKTDKILNRIKRKIPQAKITQHTKMVTLKDHKRHITIQYGRDQVVGIYSQPIIDGNKEVYLIEANTPKDAGERILQRGQGIKEAIDSALHDFCTQLHIALPNPQPPTWRRYEDWIKGEEYIDSLPRDLIIHDTYFKKVYPTGIEFKGKTGHNFDPGVLAKNYIKSRAIEDIAPEIAASLDRLAPLINPLIVLKNNVKSVGDVSDNEELIRLLSDQEKIDFSDWLISTYGVTA